MVDLALAFAIAMAIVLAFAVVARIVGMHRLVLFFITSQLTAYPHVAILLFVLAAPWKNPRQVPLYYIATFAALAATYPLRHRVVHFYSRHERFCNVFCLICGVLAGVCIASGQRPLDLFVLVAYCGCFGCLFWAATDQWKDPSCTGESPDDCAREDTPGRPK